MNESTFFLPNINEYIRSRKEMQQNIISYLDSPDVNSIEYSILIQYLNNIDLQYKKYNLIEFLNLLVAISNNHHQCHFFFDKIKNILIYFKTMIQNSFSEIDIFNIFKSNKKILLFLFEEKILIPNKLIAHKLSKEKYKKLNYHSFFHPEISKYISNKNNNCNEQFFENRKIGENENFICHLIRNDIIVDFIVYVNKTNYSLKSRLRKSLYETNQFLIDKTPSLIEYSAFFGSNQIFKYLQMNGVELTPSLWMYAIHGNNPYIIHTLEEFHINPKDNDFNQCFIEAIKCHHNDIADYININYLDTCSCMTENDQKEKTSKNDETHDIEIRNDDISGQQEIIYGFNDNKMLLLYHKYYNFAYFDEDELEKSPKLVIYYLCKYNYPLFLKLLVHMGKVNFNINTKFLFIEKQKYFKSFYDYKLKVQYNYKKIYRTLLFTAILKENIEIIKILLMFSEIDINRSSSKYIWSHRDIEENHIYEQYSDWWENKTYNIDKNDKKCEYVKINYLLNYSIKRQNIDIIKLLLSHPNINLNKKSIVKKWSYEQYDYRTTGFEKTKEKEDTALFTSIKKNDLNIIKLLLLNSNLNINEKSFIKLSDIQNQDIFKTININEHEFTALSYSIEKENVEIFKLLLSQPKIDVCCKIYEKYFKLVNKKIEEKKYLLHNWITNKNLENIIYPLKFDEKYEIEKEAFHFAVHKGNMQLIQHLSLKPEINVNANVIFKKDDYIKEETSLHIAASIDNFELFKLLLSKSNIDINKKSINILDHSKYSFNKVDDGKTFLHIAAMNNNLDMVKYLLTKKDLDINALTCGETALFISVNKYFCKNDQKLMAENNHKIVKLLISHPEIDVNYNIPLIRAIKNGNTENAKLLLSHPKIQINSQYIEVDKNNIIINRETALYMAIYHQNFEITKLLLSHPNIDIKTSFIQKDIITEFSFEKTILMTAIWDIKIAKILYKNKNNPQFWINALPIFNILLLNSDIDVNGKCILKNEYYIIEISPIYQLAKNKQVNFLKILLSNPNINVNATMYKKNEIGEKMKKTALYVATKRGYYKIAKLLLNHPTIDVNIKSNDYYGIKPKKYLIKPAKRIKLKLAAIHAAALKKDEKIMKLLLSHPKIDVNEIMYIKYEIEIIGKMTALHIAIKNNDLKIIQLLLNHRKIDINISINGITALYLAITEGNLDIVKILLSKNNIDLNVPIIINYKNMRYQISPLHYAAALKDKKIIDELFLKRSMFI